jgi:toxin-antitoxin system PIN domain toxin
VSALLADGNVLIALTVADHVHHRAALEWFDNTDAALATCPITEGTLLRFLVREGRSAADAISVLEVIRRQTWHRFWPDSLPYDRAHLAGVIGHRQVTDAYLVALATEHGQRVVTFDRGLAALHGERVLLLTAR